MKAARIIAASFALAVVGVPAAYAATPERQVDQAMHQGRDAVRKVVERAGSNGALARAVLDRATVGGTSETSDRVSALDYWRGCHPRYVAKHKVVLLGVWLGTQRLVHNGYCWRGGRIRGDSGTSVTRRVATGFCWTDASSGRYYLTRYENGPWVTPDRKRAFADATLGNYTPLGCVGHTHDRPTITYDGFGRRRWR